MRKKRRLGAGDAEPKVKVGTKRPLHSEITETEQARMLSAYSGQTCIGFLLLRGRSGVEAFTADDKSLGIFPDQKSAFAAVNKAAVS
jgi:hypothetical protein